MKSNIGDVALKTRDLLARAGIEEPRLEAELLIAMTLGISRSVLYASINDSFDQLYCDSLNDILRRRLTREPLAYISGEREFFGLNFFVSHGVFVPRPETELLVETAIKFVEESYGNKDVVIADIGTGSGAVAVSLAVNLHSSFIYATDVSRLALAAAQSNAEAHKVTNNIRFLEGDLLDPVTEPINLIVANLPYIKSSRIDSLAPEVSVYEPREALDGGDAGLDLVYRLLEQATSHLSCKGAIMLELDPEQIQMVCADVLEIFPRAKLSDYKDLAGLKRLLVIQL